MDDELETKRSQQRLVCEECGWSEDDARDWEEHLAREDDGSVTVAFFCPVCSIEV